MTRRDTLSESALFGGLGPRALDEICPLMTAVDFAPREVVFRQGERGDHLVVIETGRLQAVLELPGADHVFLSTVGPGQVVGELSLLGDGVRTATVRALSRTTGWKITRSALEILRQDVRPGASEVVRAVGEQAVGRLARLYGSLAGELSGEPPPPATMTASIGEVAPEQGEHEYVSGLLFFSELTRPELVEVMGGLPRLAAGRGAILTPPGERPSALWIVLRGAVETSMRSASATRSVRLAGPGRAAGHVGLMGAQGLVDRVEIRARERSVLLEVPWARVHELLRDERQSSRRFAAALWTDVVRALQHGERPLALRTLSPDGAAGNGAPSARRDLLVRGSAVGS